MSDDATDRAWMARAIALAERGRATVRPNPAVGCVLVRSDDVVGEGYHDHAGGPHAEVRALAAAGDRARGATAYVTLEPCDHTGRTGPCTLALLEAGVARVVYAVEDPNPLAAGGGTRLAAAGVEVVGGVLAGWAERQIERFLTSVRAGRPHVTLKLAQTWDGALTVPGRRWVTGVTARTAVHRLRAGVDAVLVGVGTVLADDPRLDVRHVPVDPVGQPRPVVLDTRGRTPATAAVVRPGAIIISGDDASAAWQEGLEERGADVVRVARSAGGHVDLGATWAALRARGVDVVLAEPGATLAGTLVGAGAVDRLVLHVARDGGTSAAGAPTPAPCVVAPATASWRWRHVASGTLGEDAELVLAPEGRVAEQRRSA